LRNTSLRGGTIAEAIPRKVGETASQKEARSDLMQTPHKRQFRAIKPKTRAMRHFIQIIKNLWIEFYKIKKNEDRLWTLNYFPI